MWLVGAAAGWLFRVGGQRCSGRLASRRSARLGRMPQAADTRRAKYARDKGAPVRSYKRQAVAAEGESTSAAARDQEGGKVTMEQVVATAQQSKGSAAAAEAAAQQSKGSAAAAEAAAQQHHVAAVLRRVTPNRVRLRL